MRNILLWIGVLFVASQLGFALPARALLVSAMMNNHHHDEDEATLQQVIDRGFKAEEAQRILRDRTQLTAALRQVGLRMDIVASDTRDSVEHDVRQVYPGVSALYLHYLFQSEGLK